MGVSKRWTDTPCGSVLLVAFCLIGSFAVLNSSSRVDAAVVVHGPRLHDNGGIGFGPLNGPQVGAFMESQFDELGGALKLKKVTLSVTINSKFGKAEFDNQDSAGGMVTLAIGSFVDVAGPDPVPGAQLIANADAVEMLTGPVAATEGEIPANFTGPDYIGLTGTASTDTDSDFFTTAAELAPYIGAGMVTFAFDGGRSTTGTVLTPFGTHRIDFPGFTTPPLHNYTFTTTLTYEYVPEPASLTLLLLGGCLLSFRRKAL
jgi:hypothetical protein